MHLGGSRAILGEGNDWDIVAFVEGLNSDENNALHFYLLNDVGYEADSGSRPTDGSDIWNSYSEGNVNLLIVRDKQFYHDWLRATNLCIKLHESGCSMADRDTRVLVHSVVRDGE